MFVLHFPFVLTELILGTLFFPYPDELVRLRPIIEKELGNLRDIQLSPDGKLLACSDTRGNVILLDSKSLEETRRLQHPASVPSVCFSPDGKCLAAASNEKDRAGLARVAIVQIWNVADGRSLHRFELTEKGETIRQIKTLAFSPDGRVIAAGSRNHTDTAAMVTLWDLENRRVYWQFTLPIEAYVYSLCFQSKSHMLITSAGEYSSNDLRVWDWKKKSLKYNLKGHKGAIYTVAASPDGTLLASGGGGIDEGATPQRTFVELMLWDLRSGERKTILEGHRASTAILTVAFSRDGTYLASGDTDGHVIIWDTANKRKLASWQAYAKDSVTRIEFTADNRLATLGQDDVGETPVIRLWDRAAILKEPPEKKNGEQSKLR